MTINNLLVYFPFTYLVIYPCIDWSFTSLECGLPRKNQAYLSHPWGRFTRGRAGQNIANSPQFCTLMPDKHARTHTYTQYFGYLLYSDPSSDPTRSESDLKSDPSQSEKISSTRIQFFYFLIPLFLC